MTQLVCWVVCKDGTCIMSGVVLQPVLDQMLITPDKDASRELLEAYLKLLAEAYQSTCNLAKNFQVRVSHALVSQLWVSTYVGRMLCRTPHSRVKYGLFLFPRRFVSRNCIHELL